MKITSIKAAKQLWDNYTEDEPSEAIDYKDGVGMVERRVCTKALVFNRDGKILTTTEWFITYGENELIYDIESNYWVNLNMFEKGESYCKEILLIEEDAE